MIRILPFIVELAMLVYCLVDCARADEGSVRNLPKLWWIVLIILLPVVGGVAWLVAGRPVRARPTWPGQGGRPRVGPLAPDDDPEFLASLTRADEQHEQLLSSWEEDLRRREQRLREQQPGGPVADGPSSGPRDDTDGGTGADGQRGQPH